MSSNLSKKITLFSFIYSIVVVAGHLIDVASEDVFLTKLTLRYTSNLVAVGMGYFFFVSGYLFYRNFDMSQLLRKWKTRCKSLAIPYIIWNILAFFIIWRAAVPEGMKFWQFFFDIKNLADGPLWYVLCLLEYVALTPIIYYLIKNKYVFWGIWLAVTLGNFFLNLDQSNTFFYSLPFYLMGAGIALHYKEKFENWASKDSRNRKYEWLKSLFLFVILTGILLIFFFDVHAEYHKYSHYLNRLLAPFITFGCFRNCDVKKEHTIWKASFFIYCGHEILIRECMHHYYVNHFLFDYPWINLSIFGIGFFTVCVVGVLTLFYLFVHKFCPRICAVLSGGR